MTDRVYPSAKPPTAAAPVPAAVTNGTSIPPTANKPHPYRPYRPQLAHRRRDRHRCPCTFCCCTFWTVLLLLALSLLAAIAGAALYVLYRPHQPTFSISALHATTVNLTGSAADPSSSRLVTSFNLTLTARNPNSHFTFFYDTFTVTFLSTDVFVGNSTLPPFSSSPKNQTVFRGVIVSTNLSNLDTDSLTALRADLKKSSGMPLKIQMDTKVKVQAGGLKSKKVGIRVTCEGIKGLVPPKGKKSPSVATVTDSKCKVDLRIKIWKFTF